MPTEIKASGEKPVARRRYRAPLLASLIVLITLGAACAEPATHPLTWAARRAEGQLQRALQAESRGDLVNARDLAGVALDESRAAANIAVVARSKALIGRLDGNHLQLLDAIELLTALGETETLVRARLDLAAQAMAGGLLRLASTQIETALDLLKQAGLERGAEARLAARAWHLYAAASRVSGAPAAALSRERQANLMLSLIRDTELPRLRQEVCQRLGDDFASLADHRQAFQQHARASFIARELEDRRAELVAIIALSQDLEAMDRNADAVGHCERALAIALELEESDLAEALAHRALQILLTLGETPGSERWLRISAVLKQS